MYHYTFSHNDLQLFKDLGNLFFFLAYGGSQARGLIGAVVAGLHHSHGNASSEPIL